MTYRMRFDVEELLSDWLVSGQKRGDFIAKVRIVDSSANIILNSELGRWNLRCGDYSRSSPPRRITPAESFSFSSSNCW